MGEGTPIYDDVRNFIENKEADTLKAGASMANTVTYNVSIRQKPLHSFKEREGKFVYYW